MRIKPFWRSWTIWGNLGLGICILVFREAVDLPPSLKMQMVVGVFVGLNIILRFVTRSAISLV